MIADLELRITTCDSMFDVCGHQGQVTRDTEEDCDYQETIWSTCCWEPGDVTDFQVDQLNDASEPVVQWFVHKSTFAPPCTMVLELCRPIFPCTPTTTCTWRPVAPAADCCDETDVYNVAQENVAYTACLQSEMQDFMHGFQMCVREWLICTDNGDVAVGDIIIHDGEVLMIHSRESECTSKCLGRFVAKTYMNATVDQLVCP